MRRRTAKSAQKPAQSLLRGVVRTVRRAPDRQLIVVFPAGGGGNAPGFEPSPTWCVENVVQLKGSPTFALTTHMAVRGTRRCLPHRRALRSLDRNMIKAKRSNGWAALKHPPSREPGALGVPIDSEGREHTFDPLLQAEVREPPQNLPAGPWRVTATQASHQSAWQSSGR